jgi:hypothetical protein
MEPHYVCQQYICPSTHPHLVFLHSDPVQKPLPYNVLRFCVPDGGVGTAQVVVELVKAEVDVAAEDDARDDAKGEHGNRDPALGNLL